MAFMAFAGPARAEALLGSNYVGGSLGLVQFGEDDMDDVFGDATALSGFGNINMHPNLDLQMGVGYLWADGDYMGAEADMSALDAGANLVYFFKPGQQLNPYLRAGLDVVKAEVEADVFGLTLSKDDTEIGFGGGGGIEFEATREILLRGGLDYFHIDGEGSFDLSGSFGYWFHPHFLGFVGASHNFDSEDTAGQIGLIFRL